ncbi:MAG: GerW family sporulation protein [Vulcanimicrobiota bacterium]
MGFGVGGSGKGAENTGSGGGGGLKVEPIAFLVAAGNEVNLLSVGRGKGLEAVFENMPNMIDRTGSVIRDLMKNKDKKTAPE